VYIGYSVPTVPCARFKVTRNKHKSRAPKSTRVISVERLWLLMNSTDAIGPMDPLSISVPTARLITQQKAVKHEPRSTAQEVQGCDRAAEKAPHTQVLCVYGRLPGV
jgi:hypothetical protein